MNHTLRMLAHRAAERAAAQAAVRPSLPPVTMPATEVDPTASWVPGGARRVAKAAKEAGHCARVTLACGPWLDANGGVTHAEQYSIVVAVQRRGSPERLVFHWRRSDTLVTAADGSQSWETKWSAADAQDGRTGRLMQVGQAEKEMRAWG